MVQWKMTPFAYIKNNHLSGIHFPLEKMIKNHPNHKGLITSPFISSSPHTQQVQWPKDESSLKVMGKKAVAELWKLVDCGVEHLQQKCESVQ